MDLKRHKWVVGAIKSLKESGRKIFLLRTDYVEPLMNQDEEREHRRSEAVRVEQLPAEVFQGYNITDDQAVEATRLGVRQDLLDRSERWFPDLEPEDHLVDQRINAKLESRAAEQISQLRSREGVWASRWRPGRGFLQNVRNLFRGDRSRINAEVAERYGVGQNALDRRRHLARNVWNGLNPAQVVLVNGQLAAMGVPPGVAAGGFNANENRLANLTPPQLEQLENGCNFLAAPAAGPLFPSRRDIEPVNAFQALVEFVEIAGKERKKALSTTVYDPQRLQQRLDSMERRHPNTFNMLVTEVLEDHALYPLEQNPEAQALVAYLEWRLDRHGINALNTELQRIRDGLPAQPAAEEAEPTEEQQQIERARELANGIAESHEQLAERYIEATALGNDLYLARRLYAHTAPPAAGGGGGPAVDTGYKARGDRVDELERELRTMRNEINRMERRFGNSSREMLNMINTARPIPAAAGPNDPANLVNFNNSPFGLNPGGAAVAPAAAPPVPAISSEAQLFGVTDYPPGGGAIPAAPAARPSGPGASAFMTAINGLTPAQMQGLSREIQGIAQESLSARERVNCRQLLYLFKERDMARRGVTNSEMRKSYGMLAANVMIADVTNIQLYRQTNQELMEMRAGTTLGSNTLDRLRKRLGASLSGGLMDSFLGKKIFRTQDVVDHIAGLDKDLRMFRGMRRDITLSELRDLIDRNGGMSSEKMFEFSSKLREVFMAFEMLNSEGKVEFFDGEAVDMENLVHNLMLIREELRTRQFFEEIRGQQGNKAELVLRKIRQDAEARNEEERTILEQVTDKFADWKQWFSRRVLGREFGGKYEEARKFIKEQGMNKAEASDYLSMQGLATAASALGTVYTMKEWGQTGKKAGRWTLAAGGSGAKGLWNRVVRPVGRYGKKPFDWFIWRPAKWTANKAGKMVAFPFVLAGSLGKGYWNWATGKGKA